MLVVCCVGVVDVEVVVVVVLLLAVVGGGVVRRPPDARRTGSHTSDDSLFRGRRIHVKLILHYYYVKTKYCLNIMSLVSSNMNIVST